MNNSFGFYFHHGAMLFGFLALFSFASCKSTEVEQVPEKPQPEQTEEKVEETNDNSGASSENLGGVDHSEENEKLIAEVESARKAAVDAGAEEYYPQILSSADNSFSETKKNFEQNPRDDYTETLKDLLLKYQSLEKAALAQDLKKKADALADDDLDSASKDAGSSALEKYNDLFANSANGNALYEQAELAFNSYTALLNKGLVARAGRERKSALAAKKDADSVKAAVAKKTKEQYKQAADKFKDADTAYSKRRIDEAYEGYKSSKETFAELFEIVRKDREEAQARLAAAKARVASSASIAVSADEEAPLSERISGIESENAVLLEKDNFANPDDAIIDVESSETATEAESLAENAIAAEESEKKSKKSYSSSKSEAAAETIIEEPAEEETSMIDAK